MILAPASLRTLAAKSFAGLCAAAAVAALGLGAVTWRADAWLYDRLLALDMPPASDDIVLVTIDDASLSALGRWPWSRSVHARLVQQLDRAGVRGIGFDVMFSEPDRSDAAGDTALANAMRRSGKVVLPVVAEPSPPDSTLIEVLPLSPLIDASAALGHVEVDIDRDGVARSAYLYAGLGSAHWPSLALALRNLHAPTRHSGSLPGLRHLESTEQPSPYLWNRDYRILLPYTPADRFRYVSYRDVLQGKVEPAQLRDRWVLVGATAAGLHRSVRAPARERPITGVEYHANALNALLGGRAITPLDPRRQLLLSIALVLLPLPLYRARHPWRRPWLAIAAGALATLAACALLFGQARVWFAPGAALAVLATGGLACALLGLYQARRKAGEQRWTRLGDERLLELTIERELASSRRSSRPLSLLRLEVDDFERYCRIHGHDAGDRLLRRVGAILLDRARRPRDLVARHGDDGLALLLPECPPGAAEDIARAVLEDLRTRAIPHPDSTVAPVVTASIGVAGYTSLLESRDFDLAKRADAALYRARREGRNRVHCSQGP